MGHKTIALVGIVVWSHSRKTPRENFLLLRRKHVEPKTPRENFLYRPFDPLATFMSTWVFKTRQLCSLSAQLFSWTP